MPPINPYYVPQNREHRPAYVSQYVGLPLNELDTALTTRRAGVDAPLAGLDEFSQKINPYYTDVDYTQQLRTEHSERASEIDWFNDPQASRKAKVLQNEYTNKFLDITKRREFSDRIQAEVRKKGEKGFHSQAVNDILTKRIDQRDEQGMFTGLQDFDYSAVVDEIGDWDKESLFDNVKMDTFPIDLQSGSMQGWLKYGTTSSNKSKITDMLDSAVNDYLNSEVGRNQMKYLTTDNNRNDYQGVSPADAQTIIREQVARAADERKQTVIETRPIKDEEYFDNRRRALDAGRDKEITFDDYDKALWDAGTGDGTKITENQLESLNGSPVVRNELTGYNDVVDISQSKMIGVPEGDVIKYNKDVQDWNDRELYSDNESVIDDRLNALMGLNFIDNASTSRNISSKYKTKEALRKAIEDGSFNNDFTGFSPSDNVGGGYGSDAIGIISLRDLESALTENKDIRANASATYGDFDSFLKATDENSNKVKEFKLSQRLSGINLPAHLSTNEEGTNFRNINGKTYVDMEAALTGEQLVQYLQTNGVTDEDLVLMRENGYLKGKGESINVSGSDIDGWEDIDDESIYSFNYLSEHVPSMQTRDSFTGATQKEQHGGTISEEQRIDQKKQYVVGEARRAEIYTFGETFVHNVPELQNRVKTLMSKMDTSSEAGNRIRSDIENRIKTIEKESNLSKKQIKLQELVTDYRFLSQTL